MPEIPKWYFIKKKSLPLAQAFSSSLQPNRHGCSLGLSELRSQEGSCSSQAQGGKKIWAWVSSLGRQTPVSPGRKPCAGLAHGVTVPPLQHSLRPGLGAWHSRSSWIDADTSMHRVCKHSASIASIWIHALCQQWSTYLNGECTGEIEIRLWFVADLFIQLLHANLSSHLHLPPPVCVLWLYSR